MTALKVWDPGASGVASFLPPPAPEIGLHSRGDRGPFSDQSLPPASGSDQPGSCDPWRPDSS